MNTHTLEAGQFIEFINSVGWLMNSINWPASSVWVFIAQLGEHCSANAEATGSNPVEAPKIFFSGYFRNCLNCDSLRWSHTHFIRIPAVHIISLRQKLMYLFDMPVHAKDYDCTPVLHTLLKRSRRSSACSTWMCMSARDNSLSSTR